MEIHVILCENSYNAKQIAYMLYRDLFGLDRFTKYSVKFNNSLTYIDMGAAVLHKDYCGDVAIVTTSDEETFVFVDAEGSKLTTSTDSISVLTETQYMDYLRQYNDEIKRYYGTNIKVSVKTTSKLLSNYAIKNSTD